MMDKSRRKTPAQVEQEIKDKRKRDESFMHENSKSKVAQRTFADDCDVVDHDYDDDDHEEEGESAQDCVDDDNDEDDDDDDDADDDDDDDDDDITFVI